MPSENSCRQSGSAAAPGRATSASFWVKRDDSGATCRQKLHTTHLFFYCSLFFRVLYRHLLPGDILLTRLYSFHSNSILFLFFPLEKLEMLHHLSLTFAYQYYNEPRIRQIFIFYCNSAFYNTICYSFYVCN